MQRCQIWELLSIQEKSFIIRSFRYELQMMLMSYIFCRFDPQVAVIIYRFDQPRLKIIKFDWFKAVKYGLIFDKIIIIYS